METPERVACATIEDVNRFCDAVAIESKKRDVPANVYREMQYYGYIEPMELKHNDIEVRPDTETGQHVFATAPIPAHTIITFYPVHALGRDERIAYSDTDPIFVERIERYARTHARYVRPLSAPKKAKLDNSEQPTDNKEPQQDYGTVLVVGNPNNTNNTRLLGHAIRDACDTNVFTDTPFQKIKEWTTFKNKVAAYYMASAKKHNCFFVGNNRHTLICIETTRDIEAGEELLVMLGPEHWFRRTYVKKDDHNLCDYLFELLTQDGEFNTWREKLYSDK